MRRNGSTDSAVHRSWTLGPRPPMAAWVCSSSRWSIRRSGPTTRVVGSATFIAIALPSSLSRPCPFPIPFPCPFPIPLSCPRHPRPYPLCLRPRGVQPHVHVRLQVQAISDLVHGVELLRHEHQLPHPLIA